ncbi:S-layer homology domain-containing protein [Tissierella carlieri]|uniref:S-layer homology domain-containing protein n=1 Tax=Tissierella carlieri TaxID=689904 RepID=A0ABT1SEF3_9FIRM|nr:S-layer homology domain-containing protein [Tissierella carlieri]MCQ4924853.1 S-layer homology domain-containing protein [Tissierella carlieri]
MKKKIAVLSMALMLLNFGVANASGIFSDVKGTEWFYKDVNSLIELGAISGYTDGTFRPSNKVSRAEFIKILITAIGEKPGATTGNWASGYISKAEELGLINQGIYQGIEGDKIITRNEIAKIVSIADSMSFEGMQSNDMEPNIKDISLIPTEYKDHVKNAYSKGIITGFPDGRFGGNEGITRAEASVITLRLIRPDARVAGGNNEVITDNNVAEEPKIPVTEEPKPQPQTDPSVKSDFVEPVFDVAYSTDYSFRFHIVVSNKLDYVGKYQDYEVKVECVNVPELNIIDVYKFGSDTETVRYDETIWRPFPVCYSDDNLAIVYSMAETGFKTSKNWDKVNLEEGQELVLKVTLRKGSESKSYSYSLILPERNGYQRKVDQGLID